MRCYIIEHSLTVRWLRLGCYALLTCAAWCAGDVPRLGAQAPDLDEVQPPQAPSSAEQGHGEPNADSTEEAPLPAEAVNPDFRAVAVAPTPSAGVPLDKLPSNAQSLDAATLRQQNALGLHDALNQQLGSVIVNDVQNNPLQPDVQFRGFTASPLLGTPQGIAVYQNGVRLNEPFGDVLQWDLIPLFALAEVQIVPGENALAGMNALGGSMQLRMKDGWSAPGVRVNASAGSFSRYNLSAEYGRVSESGWAGYAGASLFSEEGFRDHSHSEARNLYADLRKRGSDYEIGVGLTLASTDLNGNGLAPIELLRQRRQAVYTWPDNTQNNLVLVGLNGHKKLARHTSLSGTLYFRHSERATINGDEGEFESCASGGADVLCDEEGQALTSTTGSTIAADREYNAVYNKTNTTSAGLGGSVQLNVSEKIADYDNLFIAGASYDTSAVTFTQRTELGNLTVDRTVESQGIALSGPGVQTDLHVDNHLVGAYVVDTFNITRGLAIQASARLNWYNTKLSDRLGDSLNGNHSFVRLNPAIGLTQRLDSHWTLFASYGESNRAPSAAELACADPDEPCRLPNAFVADPPLKQVVSRSAEAGVRVHAGAPGAGPWVTGSAAAFGSRNYNDILFVAGSRVGTGYFRNAGETQRAGLEFSARGGVGPVSFYAAYTLLQATFESNLSLPRVGGGDDDDDDTEEEEGEASGQRVKRGSRLPGLPRHVVKAGLTLHVTRALDLSVSGIGQSDQVYRGDEANLSSKLAGFVTLNAQASYRILPQLTFFVRGQNITNTKYSTFGVLANPAEVLPGTSDPRFQSPGAPVAVFAGIVLDDANL